METRYQVVEVIISRGVVVPGEYTLQALYSNLTDDEIARCVARGAIKTIEVVEVKTETEETENV